MADRMFREKGYSSVSIADIASALQMSPANIFKHFHSKVELVDAIVQQMVDRMASDVEILDASHAPKIRIEHLMQQLMDDHYADYLQNPYIFELLLLTAQRDMQCGQHYRSVLVEKVSSILEDAKAQNIYALNDPVEEAETLLFMFKGVVHPMAFTYNDIDKLHKTCSSIVELVDKAFKKPT